MLPSVLVSSVGSQDSEVSITYKQGFRFKELQYPNIGLWKSARKGKWVWS